MNNTDAGYKQMIASELEDFADALRQYAVSEETRGHQIKLNDIAYELVKIAAEMRAEMAKQEAL